MTSLLDLLDAPAGTIATAVIDGTPKTLAIIDTAGVRRLAVQDSDDITGSVRLPDRLHSGGAMSPAVKQLHPTSAALLPERPYVEDVEDAEFVWQHGHDLFDGLPVGTIIDATPTGGDVLDAGGPGNAVLLTRVSRDGWAGLYYVSPEVGAVRDVLSGDVSRFPNTYVTAWVQRLIGDCVLADFTVVFGLAPWATLPALFPSPEVCS